MDDDAVLTAPELAKFMKTTPLRLQNDRYRGRGIPYIKYGTSVRYRWRDVREWLEANVERPRSGAA